MRLPALGGVSPTLRSLWRDDRISWRVTCRFCLPGILMYVLALRRAVMCKYSCPPPLHQNPPIVLLHSRRSSPNNQWLRRKQLTTATLSAPVERSKDRGPYGQRTFLSRSPSGPSLFSSVYSQDRMHVGGGVRRGCGEKRTLCLLGWAELHDDGHA